MVSVSVPGKFPRHRTKANKRRHKALRIKELLKERKAFEKAARATDRQDARRLARTESVFKGCEVRG